MKKTFVVIYLRVSQDMRTDSDKKLFFENPKS